MTSETPSITNRPDRHAALWALVLPTLGLLSTAVLAGLVALVVAVIR